MAFNDGEKELTRSETITILVRRDGFECRFPGCELPFEKGENAKHRLTIDHVKPQAVCKAEGMTHEQTNHIDNLQLMGKSCNAKKGQLLPDEDGNLPIKQNEKKPKVPRPILCELCMSGRLLLPGESCPLCGSGPQPRSFPRSLQLEPKECRGRGHRAPYHCWICVLGFEDPEPAIVDVLDLEG